MSFGENLQYLRRTQSMTQEGLAERMDVSRQTVSRWESDGVFPDMDKVVRLCDLFGVSMDVLLRGSAEDACADDLEEYDREFNRFSRMIAGATGLLLLGVASMVSLGGFGYDERTTILIPLFAALIVSVTIYIIAGINHERFCSEHPEVHGQYSKAETDAFLRRFPILIAVPVALILLGVLVVAVYGGAEGVTDAYAMRLSALFLAAVAISVTVLVYAGIQKDKYDLAKYNRRSQPAGASPETKREQLSSRICGVIMLLATAGYLALGFLANLWHPGWVVFPIGGILCGIVNIVLGVNDSH